MTGKFLNPTEDPLALKLFLGAIAILFVGLFLVLPLAVVFTEALAGGLGHGIEEGAGAAGQRFLEHQHQRQHQHNCDKREGDGAQRQLDPQRIFGGFGQAFAHLRLAAQD